MKFEVRGTRIGFDLRTKPGGTTSINQFVEDPDTEVYHGNLHTSVTFLDLDISVEMDSAEGNWTNAEYARTVAWDALKESLTPEHLLTIIKTARYHGRFLGHRERMYEVRKAIGLEGPNAILDGWEL